MINNIQTTNSNAITFITLTNNNSGSLLLVAPLANSILNFNYLLNGTPVTSGISGTLNIITQYKNGRLISLPPINLSTVFGNLPILGKFTQLNVTLTGLTGADTLIIYADQNINII